MFFFLLCFFSFFFFRNGNLSFNEFFRFGMMTKMKTKAPNRTLHSNKGSLFRLECRVIFLQSWRPRHWKTSTVTITTKGYVTNLFFHALKLKEIDLTFMKKLNVYLILFSADVRGCEQRKGHL